MSEEIETTEADEVKKTPSKSAAKKGLDKSGKIILIVTFILSLLFVVAGALYLKGGTSSGGNRHNSSTGGGNRYNSESDDETIYDNRITIGSASAYSVYQDDREYFYFDTGYNSGCYYIAVKNCDIIYFKEKNGSFVDYRVYNKNSEVKIYKVNLDSYSTYRFGVTPNTDGYYTTTINVLVSGQTLNLYCFD